MVSKMASKSICFGFMVFFFEILKKWLPLQPGPFFSGFAPSGIVDFGYLLEQNSLYFGLCCPVCLKMPPGCLKFAPNLLSRVYFIPN